MVLLEAMDAGCAVITTDAEGCAEVIGDAGIVVPKGDAAGIRAALRSLVDDAELRHALSLKARSRVEQFRWPRITNLYQCCFEAVVRHAGPGVASTPAAQVVHSRSRPLRAGGRSAVRG